MMFSVRADMESNKKVSAKVNELFFQEENLIIHSFLQQFYMAVPKTIRLNAKDYSIINIPKKREN